MKKLRKEWSLQGTACTMVTGAVLDKLLRRHRGKLVRVTLYVEVME